MLHISKTKTGNFIVAVVSSKNGKVISASEPLTTRTAVKRNILAHGREVMSSIVLVQDNAAKHPKVSWYTSDGKVEETNQKMEKPYVPGASPKNAKKKAVKK